MTQSIVQPGTADAFTFDRRYVLTHFGEETPLATQQLVHNRYRSNPETFVDHVLRCLATDGREALLDLGCGNGLLLREVASRLRDGGRAAAVDISPAMIDAARNHVSVAWAPVEWLVADAHDLSAFEDRSFDRVMANFIFQYIDDPEAVLREVARVLRPCGRVVVSGEGDGSLAEMYEAHWEAMERVDFPGHLRKRIPAKGLTLDTGRRFLEAHFSDVELRVYPDTLVFTSPEPFMQFYAAGHNYCASMTMADGSVPDEVFEALDAAAREIVTEHIARHGRFEVTKRVGSFVCRP